MAHDKTFSLNNLTWDYAFREYFTGGVLRIHNPSGGFHGLLQQWWDYYAIQGVNNVLLISEGNVAKHELELLYPNWRITTLDLHYEVTNGEPADMIGDICDYNLISKLNMSPNFDIVINQALLEHVYNPFEAMKNMISFLKDDGVLITMTCAQKFIYHAYPSDCFRFMVDWWYNLPTQIIGIQLLELYEDVYESCVFSCYKKIKSVGITTM